MLKSDLEAWCLQPTNLWHGATTNLLVQYEWKTLSDKCWLNPNNYSAAGYFLNKPKFKPILTILSAGSNKNQIYLEAASPKELEQFYSDNGLATLNQDKLIAIGALGKLDDALKLLDAIPGLLDCISQLVRTISILESGCADEDVSYSHPELPFSIFVSLCNERSPVASARVAESILHEAMHLRLSLIQKTVCLLAPQQPSEAEYFSPWRQGKRPINGVLHGVFVFRAILDFFRKLAFCHMHNKQTTKYALKRIQEISDQLTLVRYFYKTEALSARGRVFAQQLLMI